MKSLVLAGMALLFTGLASSATPPAKAALPPSDSVLFIRLLRTDEMLASLLTSNARESFAAGRISKSQLACLEATSPTDFTHGLAAVARKELTPEELKSAIAYLGSKDGRVFGQMISLIKAPPETPSDISPAELEAFASFYESPAGKRLEQTNLLMNTDGVGQLITDFANRAKAKCHLTQPLSPPEPEGS